MITGKLADVELLEPTDEELDQHEEDYHLVCLAHNNPRRPGCEGEAWVFGLAEAVARAVVHADHGSGMK